jgi:hypothetical protein
MGIMGPVKKGRKSPCYTVLFLHFFQKGVSRVESAFSLTMEKLGPNRRAGRLKEVVARKALKGGGDSEKREAERNQISAEVLF